MYYTHYIHLQLLDSEVGGNWPALTRTKGLVFSFLLATDGGRVDASWVQRSVSQRSVTIAADGNLVDDQLGVRRLRDLCNEAPATAPDTAARESILPKMSRHAPRRNATNGEAGTQRGCHWHQVAFIYQRVHFGT